MKFTNKLFLAFVSPALLFMVGLAGGVWALTQTQGAFRHYIETEQAVANGVSEMYAQGLQMGQAMRNIVLDPENRKAYDNLQKAREDYEKAYAQTLALAGSTPLASAVEALKPLQEEQARAQGRVIDLLKSDTAKAAQLINKEETPAWRKLKAALLDLREASGKMAEQTKLAVDRRAERALKTTAGIALLAVVVAALMGRWVQRTVNQEIGGEPAFARETLHKIAGGDLTGPMPEVRESSSLMGALREMQVSLHDLIDQVQHASASIEVATGEISMGNHDLSARTEAAASSLQETAASMEQLNGSMRHSADAARQASEMANANAEAAARGGKVVGEVVSTMDQISESSRRISDIIGVIDGIAFQTNILALNAAVEAARAGEQGRGFAVVAGEVRNLAQRSAEAAREIKTLIGTSVDRVEAGTRLVAEAGSTIGEVVTNARHVADIIGEITAASGEQTSGIGQVNTAVSQLDQMTQQNAALVEQSAAAAESLKDQTTRLAEITRHFHIHATGAQR